MYVCVCVLKREREIQFLLRDPRHPKDRIFFSFRNRRDTIFSFYLASSCPNHLDHLALTIASHSYCVCFGFDKLTRTHSLSFVVYMTYLDPDQIYIYSPLCNTTTIVRIYYSCSMHSCSPLNRERESMMNKGEEDEKHTTVV